jgi:hypothetical protein
MGSKNADIAHDRGFFVGNGPVDIEKEIKLLHETLKQIKVSASIPTTHPRNKPSQSNAEQ